jgi:ABC-2 type transport system permease protein
MNPLVNAARVGLSRGWIDFRASLFSAQELFGYLVMPIVFGTITLFIGRTEVEGGTTVGAVIMVSGINFTVVMLAMATIAQVIGVEREDGTLLRAKATPHGMVGYAVGKTYYLLAISVVSLVLIVLPGLLFADGFSLRGLSGTLTLIWVCLLGLLALAPIGASIGAVLSNPRTGAGLLMLPAIGLLMISGNFFPLALLPGWVQGLAQVFPVYWIGLGLRAALLPESYATLELAGSWRLPQVAGVLALWAVVGFAFAQLVLRRMARRESGSRVQAAREKAMKRAY